MEPTTGNERTGSVAILLPRAEPIAPERGAAPRLSSLEGRAIGIIRNSFPSAHIILAEIARLLPATATTHVVDRDYWRPLEPADLAALGARSDAVIGGIGHTPPSSSFAIHEAAVLERAGTPTVTLVADRYERLAQVSADGERVHGLSLVALPYPLEGRAEDELRSLAREAVTAVSQALTAVPDDRPGNAPRGAARVELPDAIDAVGEFLHAEGYTDGLPVIPPTEERVGRVIELMGRAAEEVVAIIPPRQAAATVEAIAVCSVMAGCRPEHVPLVAAAVAAFGEPAFNGRAVQVTSNPASVLVVVNGPVRRRLDIATEADCMGIGTRASVAIGRAVRLVLMNVGGGGAGIDMACHGFPGKRSFCFGENEEESPWEPLHVERGLAPSRDAVTLFPAQGTANIAVHGVRPDDVVTALARGMIQPGANNYTVGGEPLLVLNPGHARILGDAGISKATLRERLFEEARVPLAWYSAAARSVKRLESRAIGDSIPVADGPDRIAIVVAGAPGTHSTFVPTFGHAVSVTRPIDTPSPASGA